MGARHFVLILVRRLNSCTETEYADQKRADPGAMPSFAARSFVNLTFDIEIVSLKAISTQSLVDFTRRMPMLGNERHWNPTWLPIKGTDDRGRFDDWKQL